MAQATRGLPIEIAERPYVPVMINDAGPFSFLLDTGALGVSLSADVARALGLEEDGWVTLRSLAVGMSRWSQLGVGVGDNSTLDSLLGRRVDGILGSRFLASAKLAVTIDYPNQTLSLAETGGGAGLRPCGIPLHLANGYPLAPVHLNGTGPYLFLLDTGASACAVSLEVAKSLGLPPGAPSTARGVADNIESRRSVLHLLSVGDTHADDLEVAVMDCSTVTGHAGTRVDGYLGHNFLGRFVVTLDYPGQVLLLT